MRTVALRFGENFAPPCGTIKAHQEILDALGFVWYGKLGSPVSAKVAAAVLANEDPAILLIQSGAPAATGRTWTPCAEGPTTCRRCPPRGRPPER